MYSIKELGLVCILLFAIGGCNSTTPPGSGQTEGAVATRPADLSAPRSNGALSPSSSRNSAPPTAATDVTYTTHDSKGNPIAVFTQVQGPGNFGLAWKDPNGSIWSAYLGDYANTAIQPDQGGLIVDSAATEACSKIGGVLPTADDYEKFASYFDRDAKTLITDQGKKDLFAVFPDMLDSKESPRWFWSSSVDPEFPTINASEYSANFGGVDFYYYGASRWFSGSVRCTAQ